MPALNSVGSYCLADNVFLGTSYENACKKISHYFLPGFLDSAAYFIVCFTN
jgi:hypothetical protein